VERATPSGYPTRPHPLFRGPKVIQRTRKFTAAVINWLDD
jgi:hypothetical protein